EGRRLRSTGGIVRVTAVIFAVAVLGAACSKSNPPAGNTGTTGTSGTSTSGATQTTAAEKPTVKIEFMGALSGDYKLLVEPGFQAAKMAFDDANKSGDLPVNVVLEAQDTQGDSTQATSLVNKFITDDSVIG